MVNIGFELLEIMLVRGNNLMGGDLLEQNLSGFLDILIFWTKTKISRVSSRVLDTLPPTENLSFFWGGGIRAGLFMGIVLTVIV